MSADRSTPAPALSWSGNDLIIQVQGKPGARRDAWGRVMGDRVLVHVAAVPEQGRATARMLAFVASSFGVPKRDVTLLYGLASVKKALRVASPQLWPPELPRPERAD